MKKMNHRNWIAALAIVMGFNGLVRAAEPTAVPRYQLKPGQQLVYEGDEVVESRASRFGVERRTEIYVVSQDERGNSRAIVRQRHQRFSERNGERTDQPKRIDLLVITISPDGSIPERAIDTFGVLNRVLPQLPGDEKAVAFGWSFRGGDMDHQCRLEAPTDTGATTATFVVEPSSHMMVLNDFGATYEYTYDTGSGLITNILGRHRVKGREARVGREALIENTTMDDAQLALLAADIDRYVEAEHRYEATLAEVVGSGASPEASTRLEAAAARLEADRAGIEHELLREHLQRMLNGHRQAAPRHAARFEQQSRIIGQPSPIWRVPDMGGVTHTLTDYRGQVVVMDFWYKRCSWCVRAMPQVEALANRYAGKPVAVLGMNVDKDAADAQAVIDLVQLTYPNLRANKSIAQWYGIRGYPTLVVIDQEGVVRFIHVGHSATLTDELARVVDRLLE